MNKKVLIAMSGGVDSSACAVLLARQGYDCSGAMLRLNPLPTEDGCCGSADDAEDARAVARLAAEGRTGCITVFDVAPAYLSPTDPAELRAHLL